MIKIEYFIDEHYIYLVVYLLIKQIMPYYLVKFNYIEQDLDTREWTRACIYEADNKKLLTQYIESYFIVNPITDPDITCTFSISSKKKKITKEYVETMKKKLIKNYMTKNRLKKV